MKRLAIFLALLACLVTPAKAESGHVRQIHVGREPNRLAIDPVARRAYTTNYGSRDVSIVDLDAETMVGSFKLSGPGYWAGFSPSGIATDPATGRVFVSDYSRDIGVFSSTGSYIRTIATDPNPLWLAVDEVARRLYVSHWQRASTVVYDIDSASRLMTIPRGGAPLTTDPTRHRVVIGHAQSSFAVIDGLTGAILKEV